MNIESLLAYKKKHASGGREKSLMKDKSIRGGVTGSHMPHKQCPYVKRTLSSGQPRCRKRGGETERREGEVIEPILAETGEGRVRG